MKSGSFFLAELSRMMCSSSPGGTASASISVTNPYLYSRLTSSSIVLVAVVIAFFPPSRHCPRGRGSKLAPGMCSSSKVFARLIKMLITRPRGAAKPAHLKFTAAVSIQPALAKLHLAIKRLPKHLCLDITDRAVQLGQLVVGARMLPQNRQRPLLVYLHVDALVSQQISQITQPLPRVLAR